MHPGIVIFDDPQIVGSGWFACFEGNKIFDGQGVQSKVIVERINDAGKIPTRFALLTNLSYGYARPPRFLDEQFLGLGPILRLAVELGETRIFKVKGQGKKQTYEAADPKSVAATLARFFGLLWHRMEDLGVPLFEDGRMHASVSSALASKLLSADWRIMHSQLPNAIKQAGQVEYWSKRPLPFKEGQTDRILRRSPFALGEKLRSVPVPLPEWAESPANGTSPVIFNGWIETVPDEWASWWIPGASSLGKKSHHEKVLWSMPEWNFAKEIGCVVKTTGGFNCSAAKPFALVFPQAQAIIENLSKRSWIDGWIDLWVSRIGELPIDAQGTKSPYLLWLRGLSMVWEMKWAKTIQDTVNKENLAVEILGFGGNKLHVRHSLSKKEWQNFENIAFNQGCYALPVIPHISK